MSKVSPTQKDNSESGSGGVDRGEESLEDARNNSRGVEDPLYDLIGLEHSLNAENYDKVVVIAPNNHYWNGMTDHEDVVGPSPDKVGNSVSEVYDWENGGTEMIDEALEPGEDAVVAILGMRWPGLQNEMPDTLEVKQSKEYEKSIWEKVPEMTDSYEAVVVDYQTRNGALAVPTGDRAEETVLGNGIFVYQSPNE